MSTHLTIDLDYWTADTSIHGVGEFDDMDYAGNPEALDEGFRKAGEHLVPLDHKALAFVGRAIREVPEVFVVPQHHQIIAHLHAAKPDRVINVDYHSDLPERDSHSFLLRRNGRGTELNEGTWGLFVPDPGTKEFIWRCPARHCKQDGIGGCHSSKDDNPFTDDAFHAFSRVEAKVGLKSIPWGDITSASICLSMAWWGVEVNTIFDRWMLPETLAALGLDYDQAKKLWHPYILKGKPSFDLKALQSFARRQKSKTDGRPLRPRLTLAKALCYP